MTSNTQNTTRLDDAYQRMIATPDNDAAGLRFYEAFCDANLSVLINPDLTFQEFKTSQGIIILAFDTDERMAEFVSEPTEFLKVPGRDLVMRLLETGSSIGLNLNVAPTSQILPPETLRWVSELLSVDSTLLMDQAVGFSPYNQASAEDISAISARLRNFSGHVSSAYLCGITYPDGVIADALFVFDCDPSVEANLFTALIETQKFVEKDQADLAIKFMSSSNPALADIQKFGTEIQIPAQIFSQPTPPTAPGMDPNKPPKLR